LTLALELGLILLWLASRIAGPDTCAVNNTSAGQNPNNSPASWVKIDIPYIFGSFVSWNSCAMYYVSEVLMQEAQVVDAKAKEIIEKEYDTSPCTSKAQFGPVSICTRLTNLTKQILWVLKFKSPLRSSNRLHTLIRQ
jgi:hypothetical protein